MRYLGNKTRMLNNIEKFIDDLNLQGSVFCDLFVGSCSVADRFKDRYSLICNDTLESSCVITRAKINNSETPSFAKFKECYGVDIFDYFTQKEYDYEESHFIWMNYSPKGGRQFFTEYVANKIDGIRIELDELLDKKIIDTNEFDFLLASLIETIMGLSNTTGTYEAFLKHWDSRAKKDFVLQPLGIENRPVKGGNTVYNEDSNELVKTISGDILYLDTPYTITDYSSAYHLLETVVKYDEPSIRGITGRRVNKLDKSKYSIKNKVAEAYEQLIKDANFRHIVISYSTQSLLPVDDLLKIIKRYSQKDPIVKYYPFREYKNIRSSKKGDNLQEVLIYFEKELSETVKEIIKSPLNYSGSKNYIVDQIIAHLPKNIAVFIDAMGGAFNVGVNVPNIDTVVYNEYNSFVYEIVEMLLTEDKGTIIKQVKELVEQFSLVKGDKEKYQEFRAYYNNNKTPMNLFVLQMYCFQNQLRFNSKHDFNTPVGNCGFNETIVERIKSFVPKAKNVVTSNLDFNDLDLDKYGKQTLFYFDPPYIITNATYNDGKRGFKGWDAEQEKVMLDFLDKINQNGQYFMLSNVIEHNGKTNEPLLKWINKNGYRVIELKPHNGRYGARKEVLVVNY